MYALVRSTVGLGMMVKGGDERCRLDFTDEIYRSIWICFSAGEETGNGGCGWGEGLLWVDV